MSRGPGSETTEYGLKRLLTLLSADPEEAASCYLNLQRKLIRYFDRNLCPDPEELAAEVLDRMGRRAAEGEAIQNPGLYALGVARRVMLENKSKNLILPLDSDVAAAESGDEGGLSSLDACLEQLDPQARAMLIEYYSAEGAERIRVRRDMAERLGLSANTLRNRCLRLRRSLEDCMQRRQGSAS